MGQTPESGGRPPLGTLSAWGARAGVTMVVGDGNTLIHGGVSRRARFPALRELYSGALDRFEPNPNLRPENLVAIEAGITTRIGSGEIQAVAFRHQQNDAVVRIVLPPPDSRFMRVNRNRLKSHGIELLASLPLGRLALGGDFTLQSVDLTDPVAGVTNRPENLPEFFGSLHAGFPLALGFQGAATARYTGSQFCIHPGSGLDTRLAGGSVLRGELFRDWSLRAGGGGGRWLSRIETRLSAENAGNVALYDQCGLPQPGRLLRVQLRIH